MNLQCVQILLLMVNFHTIFKPRKVVMYFSTLMPSHHISIMTGIIIHMHASDTLIENSKIASGPNRLCQGWSEEIIKDSPNKNKRPSSLCTHMVFIAGGARRSHYQGHFPHAEHQRMPTDVSMSFMSLSRRLIRSSRSWCVKAPREMDHSRRGVIQRFW